MGASAEIALVLLAGTRQVDSGASKDIAWSDGQIIKALDTGEEADLRAGPSGGCFQPGVLLQSPRQQRLRLFEAKPGNVGE